MDHLIQVSRIQKEGYMKKIYIIMNRYLDDSKRSRNIGGVETYIYDLCEVMYTIGIKPIIYQRSRESFVVEYNGVIVHGINSDKSHYIKKVLSAIPPNEVVLFSNDEVLYGRYQGVIINIQHGIGWDYQIHAYRGELFEKIYYFMSIKESFRRIKYTKLADHVVCVDYNYVNWLRTQVNHSMTNLHVIPNYANIPNERPKKNQGTIKIIFARRFVDIRGTRLFTPVVTKLLLEYPNIHITFAGTGPDEQWIKAQLNEHKNVEFITYSSEDTYKVHFDKHIAVIPSIGSEGTSLSLLEAMASGCAVVCTNIGGMTNIVIDHYNGLMVDPKETDLYSAIKELIDSKELREELAAKAYDTVQKGFSKDKWAESWRKVLLQAISKKED